MGCCRSPSIPPPTLGLQSPGHRWGFQGEGARVTALLSIGQCRPVSWLLAQVPVRVGSTAVLGPGYQLPGSLSTAESDESSGELCRELQPS